MNDFKQMTLGVIAHKDFWADPEGLKTTGGFGRQIEELGRHFGGTILVVPFRAQTSVQPGFKMHSEGLAIIPLPLFRPTGLFGKLDFLIKMPVITRRVWTAYTRSEIVQFRLPGYVGVLGLLVHKLRRSRPGFVYLGGDWSERIRQTRDNPFRLIAHVIDWVLPWLIRGAPTFVVGKQMADRYRQTHPHVHQVVTTVISKDDIHAPGRREIGHIVKLLYVGRLDPVKGLRYLIEALRIYSESGQRFELTMAGPDLRGSEIADLVEEHGFRDQMSFPGYVPLGEKLWQIYRSADVFVLPSLSEGQPKVLIEAMANGLVVIATRVGGIPSIVEDEVNGLLVQPRSPEAIASALGRVVRDSELRERLARNAFEAARAFTIEEQTEQVVNQLRVDLESFGRWPAVRH